MPLVGDPDFTLYVGDVLEQLAHLPDGSVDCVVTSPPYWGLRDYGTGAWEGGNPDCDHVATVQHREQPDRPRGWDGNFRHTSQPLAIAYKDVCGKCGATRQDRQIGLEATPDEYVTNMVAVFREIRRVLAGHGTCWVNLGDSYAGGGGYAPNAPSNQGRGGVNRSAKTFTTRKRHPRFSTLKEKDLVGIPWRVAFALQHDGWYLRADVIWSKPNPMPESVTDRPTKSHEYVFLLSKRPRYWFDQEAVREPVQPGNTPIGRENAAGIASKRHAQRQEAGKLAGGHSYSVAYCNPAGRNVRSVWEIATQPYPEAHFATYPEELVRRCLLAGCPERVCGVCGKPSERIVDVERTNHRPTAYAVQAAGGLMSGGVDRNFPDVVRRDLGWSDCGHNTWKPGVVLDPFLGSGTTALVARKHGRRCIGIELNPAYAELAVRRNAQQTIYALLGDTPAPGSPSRPAGAGVSPSRNQP